MKFVEKALVEIIFFKSFFCQQLELHLIIVNHVRSRFNFLLGTIFPSFSKELSVICDWQASSSPKTRPTPILGSY